MTDSTKPAIVVVGYNRPRSISRLLESLANAQYDAGGIPLVISIDHADSDPNREVQRIAHEFNWEHGDKRVVAQSENLGLRRHIIQCGGLTGEFGSIILLEDDLVVSPVFYRYACEALSFFADDDRIGGISLYNHRKNFTNSLPFEPLDDGFENYFLQIASSWGQAWTAQQWSSFSDWYQQTDSITDTDPLPENVRRWPESSWLKYFIKYLVETKRFFVYPRTSLTTNFGDTGTHASKASLVWQVPLCFSRQRAGFATLDQSIAAYDCFFEMMPSRLKKIAPQLSEFDFDVDLYGQKRVADMHREMAITIKPCDNPVQSFRINMKPLVLNLSQPLPGNETGEFSLCHVADIQGDRRLEIDARRMIQYFIGNLDTKSLFKSLARQKLFGK